MVYDLSEPGPVPVLLHIKDINVKVEEKMVITPVLTETATKPTLLLLLFVLSFTINYFLLLLPIAILLLLRAEEEN